MAEEGDPQYIQNLLDQSIEHNTYFLVGNPAEGYVERIGCVQTMLMAHSLVLRRMLGTQEAALAERWDIPIPNMSPSTFKNILRYAYGHHNMSNHSLQDTLDMLCAAEQFVMASMLDDICKRFEALVDHSNVCIALNRNNILFVPKAEEHLLQVIKNRPFLVFDSPHLHEICPRNMRYILNLNHKLTKLTEVEVWRIIVKWARQKVLQERVGVESTRLYTYFQACLIPPTLGHMRHCAINIINLVEEAVQRKGSCAKIRQLLSAYHYVAPRPPRRALLCTNCRDDCHITHEAFNVKVIHDCNMWLDTHHKVASDIFITTGSKAVQFYSVVCSAIRNSRGEQMSVFALETARDDGCGYDCKYILKVYLENEEGDRKVREVEACERVLFNGEFTVVFNKMLKLHAKSKYRVEIQFKTPHPVWYTNQMDDVFPKEEAGGDDEIDVCPGLMHTARNFHGSHIKYVLYRTLGSD